MNAKILTVMFVFVTNIQLSQGRRYDNYAMYHTVPLEKDHLKFLQNLGVQNYIEFTYWRKPSKLYESVQLIVAPKDAEALRERFRHYGLKVEEIHANVQELFDAQNILRRYIKFQTDTYSWDQYHTLDDIYQWLTDVVNRYPKICELKPIGKTVEKRDIYALSIARENTKGTVIVEGGIHGNEWISTEFVTFLINHLLHPKNESDNRLIEVASEYQWYLVPVANPDGYEYSREYDRLWRKNRRRYDENSTGVDLNRNFAYSFGKFGTSNNTIDDDFCGSRAFSEVESLALSQFITAHAKNLTYYFAFHAYGQKIIIPFGDKILHVDNYADCENYGKQAIIKIYKKSGMKYNIGNSYDTLGHKISGNSADWVKHSFNVPFVYTFLLRDNGFYGYGMPPSEIIPTCEETLTAVLEIMTTRTKRLRADMFSDFAAGNGASCGLILGIIAFWLAK